MSGSADVDAYHAALPPERREAMRAIRDAIRAGAPQAAEAIAYKMPAFRTLDDRFLVSYDAYRRHYSLFPASDMVVHELGDEIRPYLAGKGTIRFPADRPIPTDLVTRIARIRWAETAGRRR
jgi:uncharacterized protein YdhG (YjbR/CyaY superfamily)